MSAMLGARVRRSRMLRRVAVASTAAAVAAGMLATASAATAGSHQRASHVTASHAVRPAAPAAASAHYAVAQNLCDQHVRPGHATCFAMRRVDVPRTTLGARPYTAPSYATGPAGGFTPGDLATAYGVNASGGKGQTVAIVDAFDDPYAKAELNTFDAHYGLPAETSSSFKKVNQYGKTSPLPVANGSWAGEIALDLQAVRGLCHRCTILLVEGTTNGNASLATAVNTAARLGADEISNSYGAPEQGSSATFQAAYQHKGIVITASTGDHGWYDWDFANDVPGGSSSPDAGASDDMPNTPAAYPSVVAVGGTALALNSNGSRSEEDVWNENGPDDENGLDPFFGWQHDNGASGGGCSLKFTAPAWQSSVAHYARTGCGSKRMTGDVAALADPYTGYGIYSHYSGGWTVIGGTSLASPLVAAIFALAGGSGGQAYPARSLYTNYAHHRGSPYDVQLGGNAFCAGDSKANCSSFLEGETSPPTGNPNNLANGSTQHDGENPPQGPGWTGLLECGYAYDGGAGIITHDAQCNAYPGYDGPSGVGAPHGLAMFEHSNPSVSITKAATIRKGTSTTFHASVTLPISGVHITKYAWTFGDGTTGSGAWVHHTFAHVETYTVRVTVTDSLGQTTTARTKVSVHKA